MLMPKGLEQEGKVCVNIMKSRIFTRYEVGVEASAYCMGGGYNIPRVYGTMK